MLHHASLRYGWVLALLLAACGPAAQFPGAPQASATPAGDWTVKLTQSGGFAGVMLTVQVSADGTLTAANQRAGSSVTRSLPPETIAEIARHSYGLLQTTPVAPHSGCADCFHYRLEFSAPNRTGYIEDDDTTLAASGAADLIRLLQQLRDDALKAAS